MECKSFVDYVRLVTQKDADEMMIDLDAGGFAVCVNAAGGIAE